MTNQLLAEAADLPDIDEYAGMSATDIAHAVINWPEGSEDQIRAISALRALVPDRHHNMPPLAEALSEELQPARARAARLVETAGTSVIVDEESAAKVLDLARQIKELDDELDRTRLARNRPYRDAQTLINRTYETVQLRLRLAYGGASGKDGVRGMLTVWENKQRADAEAARRAAEAEARAREEAAVRAREAADAAAQQGGGSVDASLAALRATDEAEAATRRAEAIRHHPTRSHLGQTTRRQVIKFEILDLKKRIAGILKSPSRRQLESAVEQITDRDLRALGVATVERGVDIAGVRAWVEEGAVSVRR